MNAAVLLHLDDGTSPFPVPTRDQAIHVRTSGMQGLWVQTDQWGWLPWFGGALGWLNAGDRAKVYALKQVAGDTHCEIILSGQYAEPNQAYAAIPGRDFSQDLPALVSILNEIVTAGFIPMLFLAGDGQGDGPGYNDPIGWSYGYGWLMSNLPRILTSLGPDLRARTLFVPGYDGVFYGWSPDQVAAFGLLFRSLLPAGYLAIEHNTGHLPVGNGPADWAPGGAMVSYDCLLSEYDTENLRQDSTWQIAARSLGPAYVRPPEQPAADDPPPAPWYLAPGTPRGPYAVCAFEYFTYRWVRGRVSVDEVLAGRAYLRSLGYQDVG